MLTREDGGAAKGLQGLYKAPKIERAKSKKTPQKGPKKKPRLSVGDSKKKPKAAKSPKKPKSKGIPKAEIIPVKKKSKMTKEEWEKVRGRLCLAPSALHLRLARDRFRLGAVGEKTLLQSASCTRVTRQSRGCRC